MSTYTVTLGAFVCDVVADSPVKACAAARAQYIALHGNYAVPIASANLRA